MRLLLGDAALAEGEIRVVWHLRGTPPRKSLLVTCVQGSLRVYWNVCQHLPIPLDAGTGALGSGPDLICSTHGARYRSSDGLCIEGPCEGASLEAVPFEVEAGKIFALI